MCQAAGIPIGLATDGANRNDCKLIARTLDSVPADHPAPTHNQPQGVCLDKVYDFDFEFVRDLLTERDLTAGVRSRGEEAKDLREDPTRHARRWGRGAYPLLGQPLPRDARPLVQEAPITTERY